MSLSDPAFIYVTQISQVKKEKSLFLQLVVAQLLKVCYLSSSGNVFPLLDSNITYLPLFFFYISYFSSQSTQTVVAWVLVASTPTCYRAGHFRRLDQHLWSVDIFFFCFNRFFFFKCFIFLSQFFQYFSLCQFLICCNVYFGHQTKFLAPASKMWLINLKLSPKIEMAIF